MTTLAVTGHRPDRLFGGSARSQGGRQDYVRKLARAELRKLAEQELKTIAPERVLTGMALGWDQVVAEACLNLSIPFLAYIPCDNQDAPWMQADKIRYQHLLGLAAEVVNVSPGHYTAWKMFKRNEALVDNCDMLLTLWDGDYSGGTGRCVMYAERQRLVRPTLQIRHCWDLWVPIYAELQKK